jgi:Ca-activated chloride channel family protein
VDSTGDLNPFGGTAIGDALALAVRLGREISDSPQAQRSALGDRSLAAHRAAASVRRPLVSILFLSDGHQNSGKLQPLQGARRAKAAGFPVYTVALGTTADTTLRGSRGGGVGGIFYGNGSSGVGYGGDLGPDPRTLRQIAQATGGKFFRAKTAGAVEQAYARLGSELGRVRASEEITDEFVAVAAALLLLAGLASALWAPRLP